MKRVDLKFIETHCVVGDKITVRSAKPGFYGGNGLYDGLVLTVSAVSGPLLDILNGKPFHAVLVKYQPMKEGCSVADKRKLVRCPSGELMTDEAGEPLTVERKLNERPGQDHWLEVDDEITNRAPVRD